MGDVSFNLSDVFATVARTIPDQTFLAWRDRPLTYADVDARVDGFAHYLTNVGLGCHTERDALAGHESAGAMSMMILPPFMHGAAQWAGFNALTMDGRLVIPDDVERLRPDAVLRLAERGRVLSIPVVGDAIARPLIDAIETGDFDLCGLATMTNGGAPLSPTWATRRRPHARSPRSRVRWSVPGDRANVLDDGRIQLLGRDSVTINSGGEKILPCRQGRLPLGQGTRGRVGGWLSMANIEPPCPTR